MPVVAQAGDDTVTAVARTYREFARLEARGRSAAYEALAESVAGDAALVSFIASLPPAKRQPNLLFAAAGYLLGAPPAIGPGTEGPARDGHSCVLARDGHCIAVTESHGMWLRWLP